MPYSSASAWRKIPSCPAHAGHPAVPPATRTARRTSRPRRSAADRGPRRKQHEARSDEHPGREVAAHREIVGDILRGRIPKSRQRDMRGEFSSPGSSPIRCIMRSSSACSSINGRVGAMLATTARGFLPPKLDRPWTAISKGLRVTRKSREAIHWRRHHRGGDEAQGDVIILGLSSALRAIRRAKRKGFGQFRPELPGP